MIGSLTSSNMHMLESSMNYLWTKQAVIADNVANAETPNYKAKYVEFENSFQQRLINAVNENQTSWERAETIQNSSPITYAAVNEVYKSDGNGVDVAEQEMEAVRTNYQLQYVLGAITSEFSLLRSVING